MTARNARGLGDVVVSPHELATAAGMDIFAAGGTAVDAAVAVNAVQGVVAPETCGVGGDLFALVWEPGMSMPATLNASGWAGSRVDPDELSGLDTIPSDHPSTVTIPGCVAGWGALHERFGRLPLATVLGAAIRHAEDGFPASAELATAFTRRQDELIGQDSASDLYPGGRAPRVGEVLRRRLLAKTLSDIVTDGPHGFYTGAAGVDIAAAVEHRITPRDLAEYRPDWIEPARLEVLGRTGWTIPPNSQGYITLATLALFERLGPPEPDDPLWSHLLIESYRAVAWERDELVADPRMAPLTWEELLAPDRLAERAGSVDPGRAGRHPRPAPAQGGTAYMCAVSAAGQTVSLIQSNFMGIGSGIGAGRSGFLLHNRGAGFDLRLDHPNRLAPLRRPLHTLSPTLWTVGDRLDGVFGTRGGHQQPQLLAQMAASMFVAGLDPAEAQSTPRWTLDESGDEVASKVVVERDFRPEGVAALEARGHAVEVVDARQRGWGPVSCIRMGPDGVRTAASDPRVETASAGVR